MTGDDSMMDLFREEVRSHAATLSRGLVALENAGGGGSEIEPLMRAAHSIKGAARIVNVEAAVRLAHAMEDALVSAQEGRIRLGPGDIDLLLRGSDVLSGLGETGGGDAATWSARHAADIADLQERFGRIAQGQPAPPSANESPPQPPPQPVAVAQPVSVTPVPQAGDGEGGISPAAPAPTPVEAADAVVRVTALSLNRLMGLAGESLVQARWLEPFSTALLKLKRRQDHLAGLLDHLAGLLASGRQTDQAESIAAEARRQCALCRDFVDDRRREFQDHAARAEDLNSRLYREVISSRMRPFGDGAHGFPRLVRDVARHTGKQVRLEVEGQATEVDRDILEKLEAPLTHLLRNAVDHGLEPPDERRAAGKPETAVVRVEARHRAGALAITVSDDGRGIDLDRLRAKVVERRLSTAALVEAMSEAELLEFLFLPGFSTAGAVTEYSGRGVGLDVVQTTLRQVGGSVRISTRPGRGTTFHLQLPITLSVLRAVVVDVAGEPYAFAHNRIDRLVRVPASQVRSLEHRQFVVVDGQNVGLALAAQLLDLPVSPPDNGELTMLLLSDTTGTYGLIVEGIRGEQDLVVRPLDPRLGKVPNISAAAILDDGSPVLIADVEDLIRSMDQFIQGNKLRRYDREEQDARPGKRVLVVDDSITVREVERQLLRNHGYDVTVAVDGQQGWNMVRAEHFDLVITDVDMPRMNGLELVAAMRNDPTLRAVPVVIVSYKEREQDRLRGLEVGANYYLTKSSFHDNTFLQAVTDLIGEA
jgi:two-component system sensor histidine kinase and response regulator WspE